MKKLLLVDDHPVVRDGIVGLCRQLAEEIEVTQASSCEEAFALLARDAEFDLVLMDLLLPGLSGAEGIKRLREDYPMLPVVALSARTDSRTIRATIDSGAMGFIPKTHSDELLRGALELILVHKGIYLPPEILSDAAESSEGLPSAAIFENVTTPESMGLTPRQADVLYQLVKGYSNKEIAQALGITESTVRVHVNVVLRALNVTNRTKAVIAVYQRKLVFGQGPGARIRYTCPDCRAEAWGRGGLELICGRCHRPMPSEHDDTDAGPRKRKGPRN